MSNKVSTVSATSIQENNTFQCNPILSGINFLKNEWSDCKNYFSKQIDFHLKRIMRIDEKIEDPNIDTETETRLKNERQESYDKIDQINLQQIAGTITVTAVTSSGLTVLAMKYGPVLYRTVFR